MKKQIATTGFLLFSFLLPLKANAATFNKIYVFGDSLSDTGNLPVPPPYVDRRFSNGNIWIDYLAQGLGLSPTNYTDLASGGNPTQGINFAFGGATTGTDNTIEPILPGLQQQIGAFASLQPSLPTSANEDALYVVLAGANDYLPTESKTFTPFAQPNNSIENLLQALGALKQFGAKNIMVVNLPDLGKVPLTRETADAARLSTLSKAHNTTLAATLNSFSNSPNSGVNIIPIDVASLVDEAIAKPDKFGFTNVTQGCLIVQCTNPNEYFFWDRLHPTTTAHKLIGDLALSKLNSESVPEPSTGLAVLALGAGGTFLVRKREKNNTKSG